MKQLPDAAGTSATLNRPRTEKQIRGQAAEDRALAHLMRHGLTLIERNFLCRGGEIDLVMQQQETLVFVEVRQRSGKSFGGAAASVTPAKQRRMILAAQTYLQRHRTPPPCRFDVVAIDGETLEWLANVLQG